jgi:hypothetical protein
VAGVRVALAAASLGAFLLLLAQFTYLVPDSAGHVAWCRSLVWDRDLDFANDYARLGMIEREAGIDFAVVTPAGRRGNPFGLGAALLWTPFVLVEAMLARTAAAAGGDVSTDGFGTGTLLVVSLASWTLALGALLLLALCIREVLPDAGPASRWTGVTAAGLGTPLVYYVLQMPTYSHAASAFMVACSLALGLRWRAQWTLRRALVLGALAGLAGLVRIQDMLFVLLPPLLAIGGALRRRGRAWLLLAPYVVVATGFFGVQLLAWARIYGRVTIPQGGAFLGFDPERIGKVLFATRHGLFTWSPVLLAALLGWGMLARRGETRWVGIAALLLFCLQTIANALPVDWWAGWAFGARRYTDQVALFGLGIAVVARSRRARVAILAVVGLQLVQWLRVATRALSGEADPGWNALWGTPAVAAVARAPADLWKLVRIPWTHLDIVRRPQSLPPALHADAAEFLALCAVLWLVAVFFAARRVAAAARPSGPVAGRTRPG